MKNCARIIAAVAIVGTDLSNMFNTISNKI